MIIFHDAVAPRWMVVLGTAMVGASRKNIIPHVFDGTLNLNDSENPTWLQAPGLGWGMSAATDEYTTPICFDSDLGSLKGVVKSTVQQAFERRDYVYKTNTEIQLELENLIDGTAGGALLAAAKSLLAHSSGALSRGYELVQYQYYVPVIRLTIQDPVQNCQTAPIQILTESARTNELGDRGFETFLKVHGTHFVHSVILGGQLSIFHVRKSSGVHVDIMAQSGNVNLMSSSMYISIMGGRWDPQKADYASADNLREAVDDWLQSVQSGVRLTVLQQETTPIHMLLPPEFQFRAQEAETAKLGAFANKRFQVAESLRVMGVSLAKRRSKYASSSKREIQAETLSSMVHLLGRYCDGCDEHSHLYNSGFVEMHTAPPATCRARCLMHLFFVCKDAVSQMDMYNEEMPTSMAPILHPFKGYWELPVTAALNSRRLCRELDPVLVQRSSLQDAQQSEVVAAEPSTTSTTTTTTITTTTTTTLISHGDDDGINKPSEILEAELSTTSTTTTTTTTTTTATTTTTLTSHGDDDTSTTTTTTTITTTTTATTTTTLTSYGNDDDDQSQSAIKNLGWSMLPVSDAFVLPLCSDSSGRIHGVAKTTSTEPLQPMVQVYNSDMELKLSFSESNWDTILGLAGAIKELLAKFNGTLSEHSQLVHMSISAPMTVHTMSDPASACWNSKFKDLERKFDAGSLNDEELDRFLLMTGTRVATSVSVGGRLDVLYIQQKGSVALDALTAIHAKGSYLRANMAMRVLGGKWTQEAKPDSSGSYAGGAQDTLQDAARRWLASIQDSQNLAVLAHTTIPISALLSSKMQSLVEARTKHVTEGWMYFITVSEKAEYLRARLQKKQSEYRTHWFESSRVELFNDILGSLDEICDVAEKYRVLWEKGYMSMVSGSQTPSSYTKHCQTTLHWVCDEALSELEVGAGFLQQTMGGLALPHVKKFITQKARNMCAKRGLASEPRQGSK